MGRTAYILIILFFIGRAFGQSSNTTAAGENPHTLSTLRFRLYQQYLIVAEGAIGNVNSANLLIDTGSDSTILDKRVAQKLHLKLQPARIGTFNGQSVTASRALLPYCRIGPISCLNFNVLIEDLSFLQHGLGTQVDVIIGLDLLSSLNFTVDYPAERIIFGIPQSPAYKVAFASGPPLVSVAMALNGRPMQMLIDTGASSFMIFKTRWPEAKDTGMFFVRPKEQVQYSTNMSGEFERHRLKLEAVLFGSLDLGNQSAYLIEDQLNAPYQFDGLFNPVLLRLHQISFDFEKNQFGWAR